MRDSIELNVPWWGVTALAAQRKRANEGRGKAYWKKKKKEPKLRRKWCWNSKGEWGRTPGGRKIIFPLATIFH